MQHWLEDQLTMILEWLQKYHEKKRRSATPESKRRPDPEFPPNKKRTSAEIASRTAPVSGVWGSIPSPRNRVNQILDSGQRVMGIRKSNKFWKRHFVGVDGF